MNDAVFLHFLNRELLRSVGKSTDLGAADFIVRCLLLATNANLYGNFSIVSEGGYLTKNQRSIVADCIKLDELELVGERATADEFIATRQSIYLFDHLRYPMYFGDAKNLEGYLNGRIIRDDSVTDNLATILAKWVDDDSLELETIIGGLDAGILTNAKNLIGSALKARTNKAMTLSLFNPIFQDKEKVEAPHALARLLSALYAVDYMSLLEADIATGISQVAFYDRLSKGFPYFDIPILSEILKRIGFNQLLTPFSKKNEAIIYSRNADSHILLADCIFDFILNVSADIRVDEFSQHISRRKMLAEIRRLLSEDNVVSESKNIHGIRDKAIGILNSGVNKIKLKKRNAKHSAHIHGRKRDIIAVGSEHKASLKDIYSGIITMALIENIVFDVALSFPSEKRTYVENIANVLRSRLKKNKLFYDADFQAQLARPNLDVLLQKIYNKNSKLVVIFLCSEYSTKEWCGLEWRAIRDVIKRKEDLRLMFIRLDSVDVDGVLSIDGYIDAGTFSYTEIAEFILERARLLGCQMV